MADYTDSELIVSWQDGNEQAFAELYKEHAMNLLAIAMNKTNDRDNAKELVQDTFVKLYQHKDALSPDTSIRAYLYVILKNKILNYNRSQAVQHKYENYLANHQSMADDTMLQGIETRELEKQLNEEIERLPEKCRAVFLLSRRENFTNRQIAKQLNISENTVEQHMRKALSRLRHSLEHYLELAVIIYLLGK